MRLSARGRTPTSPSPLAPHLSVLAACRFTTEAGLTLPPSITLVVACEDEAVEMAIEIETPISTKEIPISTKGIPISTKDIPISTKDIPLEKAAEDA